MCSYMHADAAPLPCDDGAFDALLCVAAVPYFADVGAALAEWRLLGPQGRVVVTVPCDGRLTIVALLHQAAAAKGGG
jgi:ubiquinone/menaquinone biosynthesis C-methylase UbiE